MRARIALLVVLLVILPTALLSLLAGRALRHWELVLQRQLQENAQRVIDEVAMRLREHLEQELQEVRTAVAGCFTVNRKYDALVETTQGLKESHECVADVFVFMNPWGFVFPEEVADTRTGGGGAGGRGNERAGLPPFPPSLLEPMRRAISLSGPSRDRLIAFKAEGSHYCLVLLDPAKALYVGYRVAAPGLKACLARIMREHGGGLSLEAEGLGFLIEAQPVRDVAPVIVSDSLTGQSEEVVPVVPVARRPAATDALATARLQAPFEDVRLRAFLLDPTGTRRAQAMRTRLFGWGIVLLAGAIIAGVWLVLSQVGAELRRVRARSDFVLGVSHDLRTPLASMKMLAESLHLGRVTEASSRRRFLETIVQECDRLGNLIERVLFFVRLGQGALVYRFESLDMNRLVAQAIEVASRSAGGMTIGHRWERIGEIEPRRRGNAEERREETDACGDSGEKEIGTREVPATESTNRQIDESTYPAPVRGDEGALMQVLLNLLDNGMKYGRKGSGFGGQVSGEEKGTDEDRSGLPSQAEDAGTLTRSAPGEPEPSTVPTLLVSVARCVCARHRRRFMPQRDWIEVSVADDGPGMSEEEARRAFTRFYRGPGRSDQNVSGVGLGLTLCRHIVESHGGWIEVSSRPGEGTTFTFYLPASDL